MMKRKKAKEYRATNETEKKIIELINKVTPTGEKKREIKGLRRLDGLITGINIDYFPKGSKKRWCVHTNTQIVLTGMIQDPSAANKSSCPYEAEAIVTETGPRSGIKIWIPINCIGEIPAVIIEEESGIKIGAESRIIARSNSTSAARSG